MLLMSLFTFHTIYTLTNYYTIVICNILIWFIQHHYSITLFWISLYSDFIVSFVLSYVFILYWHYFNLKDLYSISCKAELVVMNSPNFCFSENSLSLLHLWRAALVVRYTWLAVFLFFFFLSFFLIFIQLIFS